MAKMKVYKIKTQVLNIECDGKQKVYPHKDCTCYFNAHNLLHLPRIDEGIIGGFFDELFTLKKGKQYKITVEELPKLPKNWGKVNGERF